MLLIAIMSFSFAQQNTWTWQNPLPQGNTLRDACIFDEDNIIAVGDAGTIIKTIDSGSNWGHYQFGEFDFKSVDFVNSNNGWTVSSKGIYHTSDGGDSWSLISNNGGNSIEFVNQNLGWVVGDSGKIKNTINGGITWTDQISGTNVPLYSVYFFSENIGWACGEWIILKTINGGSTWTTLIYDPNQLGEKYSVFFINQNVGWVAGESGLHKTTDGGTNWQYVYVNSDFFSVYFMDENIGWMVGSGRRIYKTYDGGNTWNSTPIEEVGFNYYTVQFIDQNTGFVAGGGGRIYKTNDGGQTWGRIIQTKSDYLNSVFFTSNNNGYAVGDSILQTIDGGETWTVYNQITPNYEFYTANFPDNNNGYIGGSGEILKTMDGGNNWNIIHSGFAYDIYDIEFLNSDTGWCVGSYKIILKTTDGGQNWITQSNTSDWADQIFSIFMMNENLGWAVGLSQAQEDTVFVLKTANGGNSWNITYINQTGLLFNSVFFTSDQTGWIVGDGLWKTTDGGYTWIRIDYYPNEIYGEEIFFSDQMNGWIVGADKIYGTSNGGATWDEIPNPTKNSLKSIYFTDNSNGWTVGNAGTIISTFGGGIVKTVHLLAPNGGENWEVGTQQNIGWTSTNVSEVNLEYSTNNSSSWDTIATNISASNGSHLWTIPNTPSTACLVKISDSSNPNVNDVSDGVFTIQVSPQSGSISGYVFDAEFKDGIYNAQVILESASLPPQTVYTTNNGYYTFANLLPGTYTLTMSHPDYVSRTSDPFTLPPNTHLNDVNVELGRLVVNGDILLNTTNLYYFMVDPYNTSTYEFVFDFDEKSSTQEPNWSGFQLIVPTGNNILILVGAWDSFSPARYTWYVRYDDGTTSETKAFIKVEMQEPANLNPNRQPVLLVHGIWGGGQSFNRFQNRFAEYNAGGTGYEGWIIGYPNTGNILWCASAIPKAIEYIKRRLNLPIGSKISVLSHSMGGLITRTYTVGKAVNVIGEPINYRDDIDTFIMIAPPNQGGRFTDLFFIWDLITPLPASQYAMVQLETGGYFLNSVLTKNDLNPSIEHLIIAGNNSSLIELMGYLIGGPVGGSILQVTLPFWRSGLIEGQNDVPVYKRNTILDNVNYYKVIQRHHLDIHQPLDTSDPVFGWVIHFLDYGSIVSDDIHKETWLAKIFGKFKPIRPFELENTLPASGVLLSLKNIQNDDLFYAISNDSGYYNFDNLPTGDYQLSIQSESYIEDSLLINVPDSNSVIHQNVELVLDSNYTGPLNPSIMINNGGLITQNQMVECNIFCENAAEFKLSERLNLDSLAWQPYIPLINFLLSGNYGKKTIFAKFRNATGLETNIIFASIRYDTLGTGNIHVTANESHGIIYLDNQIVAGAFPYTINNVPVGEHEVSAVKSGFLADTSNKIINVKQGQINNVFFQFSNYPPQPPTHFAATSNLDTIRLAWRNTSVQDLASVRLLYRLDSVFPSSPNDGAIIYDEVAIPDGFVEFDFTGILTDTTYYFAAFSKDSAGYNSSGANLEVGPSCTQGLLGDISDDSLVNSTDALIILSYDVGLPILQPILDRINLGFGDVNEDGTSNSTDALIILSYDVGIPVPFPVGDPVCLPNSSKRSQKMGKSIPKQN